MFYLSVFLIASAPSRMPSNKTEFGHLRLKKVKYFLNKYKYLFSLNYSLNYKILSDNFELDKLELEEHDKLVYQFSSIGSLGANENNWLCKEFTSSMATKKEGSTHTVSKPICVSKITFLIYKI